MKNRIFSLAVALTCFVAICARAADTQQGSAQEERGRPHRVQQVVIVQGEAPAKVKVGQIIRVQGSAPAGQAEMSVKIEGPVKLVRTNDVAKVVDGRPLIGETIREFEVRARKKGKATVTITIHNKVQKTTETKKFTLEIE